MEFIGSSMKRKSKLCNGNRLVSALHGLLAEEPEDSAIKVHGHFWLLCHSCQLQSGHPLLPLSTQE